VTKFFGTPLQKRHTLHERFCQGSRKFSRDHEQNGRVHGPVQVSYIQSRAASAVGAGTRVDETSAYDRRQAVACFTKTVQTMILFPKHARR
jgi:hypothetical protein